MSQRSTVTPTVGEDRVARSGHQEHFPQRGWGPWGLPERWFAVSVSEATVGILVKLVASQD